MVFFAMIFGVHTAIGGMPALFTSRYIEVSRDFCGIQQLGSPLSQPLTLYARYFQID